MKILVIGESCNDVFHYGICNRLCPEAPVPVFNSSKVCSNGGMALNVFNNLVSLGIEPHIKTNHNWRSITKTRFVDRRTNHMFMRLDENDDKYGSCDIHSVDLSEYDAVIVSDYDKGFLTEQDLKYVSDNSKLSFLDTKKILDDWAKNFSFIKINHHEYEKTKRSLTNSTKKNLIVTKGPHGCIYRGKVYNVPLVEVKDTSGAGDTFVASLCFKYCETNNVDEAIKFANECSTKVVQKMGVVAV